MRTFWHGIFVGVDAESKYDARFAINIEDVASKSFFIVLHDELATMSSVMRPSTAGASSSAPVAHNAVPPPPTTSASRSSRIAPHSHIKGLGLNTEGFAVTDSGGFVGQVAAREVCLACGFI